VKIQQNLLAANDHIEQLQNAAASSRDTWVPHMNDMQLKFQELGDAVTKINTINEELRENFKNETSIPPDQDPITNDKINENTSKLAALELKLNDFVLPNALEALKTQILGELAQYIKDAVADQITQITTAAEKFAAEKSKEIAIPVPISATHAEDNNSIETQPSRSAPSSSRKHVIGDGTDSQISSLTRVKSLKALNKIVRSTSLQSVLKTELPTYLTNTDTIVQGAIERKLADLFDKVDQGEKMNEELSRLLAEMDDKMENIAADTTNLRIKAEEHARKLYFDEFAMAVAVLPPKSPGIYFAFCYLCMSL